MGWRVEGDRGGVPLLTLARAGHRLAMIPDIYMCGIIARIRFITGRQATVSPRMRSVRNGVSRVRSAAGKTDARGEVA